MVCRALAALAIFPASYQYSVRSTMVSLCCLENQQGAAFVCFSREVGAAANDRLAYWRPSLYPDMCFAPWIWWRSMEVCEQLDPLSVCSGPVTL